MLKGAKILAERSVREIRVAEAGDRVGRMFGTDGVRGVAGADLSVELTVALGRAGATLLGQRSGRRPRLLVGRDTRRSGAMLEAALCAGAMSAGADVLTLGVATTPAVAYLVRVLELDAGVVISASHNPAPYNGIKFFDGNGYKLPDSLEDEIEHRLQWRRPEDRALGPTGAELGVLTSAVGELERYVAFLASVAGDLGRFRIVCDCANGAAWQLAPEVFRRAGAEVHSMFCDPDGLNINDGCGSLHPEALQTVVRERGADLGLAFDGDADRLIAVDEKGQVVDGDQVMAVLGLDLLLRDALPGRTVVGTVMSNYGLEVALAQAGGRLVRTRVGDRYVLEEMRQAGYILGGEQSGHIILLDHHTTGDGLCTAAALAALMRRKGQPLSELAAVMPHMPQVLQNVPVRTRDGWDRNGTIQAAIAAAEGVLAGRGRVVVRPSGTEPLLRIMVEGEDEAVVRGQADVLTQVVRQELG